MIKRLEMILKTQKQDPASRADKAKNLNNFLSKIGEN
jgi:hypothetical protein